MGGLYLLRAEVLEEAADLADGFSWSPGAAPREYPESQTAHAIAELLRRRAREVRAEHEEAP